MIKWHKETGYSKIATVIFFLGIFPVWSFYLGMQIQLMQDAWRDANRQASYLILRHSSTSSAHASTTTPLGDLSGTYTFDEISSSDQDVPSEPGWQYVMKIARTNNPAQYTIQLDIDGFQMFQRIKAHGRIRGGLMNIFFDEYTDSHSMKFFENGDVLFNLVTSKPEKLKINWQKMQPGMGTTDKTANYFIKTYKGGI
jgi:hypothetical protein